jgi:peptidoglycan/LPS O-acetylase OafA/YrhL
MHAHSRISADNAVGATRFDIPALTGFRFLSALFVLVGHGYKVVSFEATDMIGDWLGPLASCGMSMFFVLSGFLMWLNYGELYRHSSPIEVTRRFAAARFARLYPMLFCTLLVASIVRWKSVAAAIPAALLYPLMMNAWFPGRGPVPITLAVPAAAHTWSISVEIFCYLLFPAFALVFCYVRSQRAILAYGVFLLAVLLLITFFAPRHLAEIQMIFETNIPTDQLGMWVTYYSPITRIFEFGIGCVAACYFMSKRRPATGSGISTTSGLVMLLMAILVFGNGRAFANAWALHDLTIRAGLAVGSALLVYGMASNPDHLISRILSTKPALIGGEISYSTYLIHPFVFVLVFHQALAPDASLLVAEWLLTMVAAFAAVYIVSYASYRVIEVPTRKWIKYHLAVHPNQTVRLVS